MYIDRHPLQIFVILLIFVFAGEVGIMFVLDNFDNIGQSPWLEAIADAAMLTSLCFPFFWYFFLKPLQRSLQLENIKSHKILEMAADGIVSIDSKGMILSFNRAARKIFGYKEREVLGKNVSLLVPPPYRDQHDGFIASYLQTGKAHIIGRTKEMEGVRKDGIKFPMELGVTEVKFGDTHLFTAVLRDISEKRQAQLRIEQLAHYDTLTQLPNRSLFYDRLRQAIMIAKRIQRSIVLLYISLEGFKKVNDALGHHIGDLLMAKVSERLRQCVRESDTLARFAGDEFTLILNDIDEHEDVKIVAQKIIDSVSQPFDLEGLAVQIGVSIGIARFPDDAMVDGELLMEAGRAMYIAKAAGKNTYRFSQAGDAAKSFQALDRGA